MRMRRTTIRLSAPTMPPVSLWIKTDLPFRRFWIKNVYQPEELPKLTAVFDVFGNRSGKVLTEVCVTSTSISEYVGPAPEASLKGSTSSSSTRSTRLTKTSLSSRVPKAHNDLSLKSGPKPCP